MRKGYVLLVIASLIALAIGIELGFKQIPPPQPKQVVQSATRPDDFQAGLKDAKDELKTVQRFSFKSTIQHDEKSETWIYSTATPERIAVDWYYVASYPEQRVQMTRNDVARIIEYDRYLVVIRPIYGVVGDSELEQFSLRFSGYFMTKQQQKEDDDVR
ncbi:hypothetical protein [Exiguobacterium sp. s193]|uniref:hypothetical protein n=1 Tax=Exiguobacterium sp. s193 TaxID=2751207 RepID=UPI001BE53D32|nr:hypothetical protein [Exiguobacterium sp. s193]